MIEDIEDIKAIMITLDVAENHALFILLSEDGTINRQGTGSERDPDRDLFIVGGLINPCSYTCGQQSTPNGFSIKAPMTYRRRRASHVLSRSCC